MKRIHAAAAVLVLFFNILCYAAEVEIILNINGQQVPVKAYLSEFPAGQPPQVPQEVDPECVEISAEKNQLILFAVVKQDLESVIRTLRALAGAKEKK